MSKSATIDVINKEEEGFPVKLLEVKPLVNKLWYKGKWDREIFSKCVTVVGSRKMTKYGKQVLASLIPQLVMKGYTTVSGFMYGVDMEVHRLTYLSGGRTIAVLGWGIEHNVDIESRQLYDKLVDSDSLIMSEYTGETAPSKFTFPQRNRIVAGLSSEVIVVEGAKASGSLITAHLALKQGKKLWAVPGSVMSKVSEGTNALIKDGLAKMLTMDDINNYSNKDSINQVKHNTEGDEFTIVDRLRKKPENFNNLVRVTGWKVGRLGEVIMKLEMKGVVKEKGGVYQIVE